MPSQSACYTCQLLVSIAVRPPRAHKRSPHLRLKVQRAMVSTMGSEEDRALYHALSTCMHSAAIYLAIYSSSHAVLRDAVSHTSNACAHLEWESRWCVLSSHQYSSDRWEGGHGTSGEPEEPPDEVSHSLTCVAVIGRSVYELTRTSDRWKSEWVAPPVRDCPCLVLTMFGVTRYHDGGV